jgi:hypothetical protein
MLTGDVDSYLMVSATSAMDRVFAIALASEITSSTDPLQDMKRILTSGSTT